MGSMLCISASMSAVAAAYMLALPMLRKRYSARSLYYGWAMVLAGFLIPLRPR